MCDRFVSIHRLQRSWTVVGGHPPHRFNTGRDQSDRSDFALTKTFDETGRRATPICVLFLRSKMQNWNSMERHEYAVLLSDLVMFI